MSGALKGIRVVDLSRVLAGPMCAQILSDHGAEVVKVEPPAGDDTRTLPPFDAQGDAAYFNALNRGKQCIALDLARPAGRQILERLLERADVLVENFLPGTLEKWGMPYEGWIRERFPRLIHCSISGFGADGPLGGMPGYDAVVQALCGLMSINGDSASGPTRIGIPVVDHLTAYTALTGILLALQARHRTGRGQHVEATLFDAALSLLVPHASNYLVSGREPGLLGSAHPNIAPYDRFRCQDGEVFIGIMNRGQFERFCSIVQRPALADDARFADNALRVENRQALKDAITAAIASLPRQALCESLMRAGVPASPVHSVSEALAHPHARHRRMVVEREGYRGLGMPVQLQDDAGTPGCAPAAFNADAARVLADAGYTPEDIQQWSADGTVPTVRAPASMRSAPQC